MSRLIFLCPVHALLLPPSFPISSFTSYHYSLLIGCGPMRSWTCVSWESNKDWVGPWAGKGSRLRFLLDVRHLKGFTISLTLLSVRVGFSFLIVLKVRFFPHLFSPSFRGRCGHFTLHFLPLPGLNHFYSHTAELDTATPDWPLQWLPCCGTAYPPALSSFISVSFLTVREGRRNTLQLSEFHLWRVCRLGLPGTPPFTWPSGRAGSSARLCLSYFYIYG